MRKAIALAAAAAMLALLAGPATAARSKPTLRFFSTAQSDAHWTPRDSADANRMAIELEVGPEPGAQYAGMELLHVEGTLPPVHEPGFWHKEDRAGQSGGSPRLVLLFEDGNTYLRPDDWTTTWQHVGDGQDDGNWDVSGGSCGFLYDTDYATAIACFAGQPLRAAYVVTDSNWLYGPYTSWIDRLQYGGHVFSHARDTTSR